jgi:pimeloyl-ACP methyl ester carboxylesterase
MDVSGCARRARSISAETFRSWSKGSFGRLRASPQPDLFNAKAGGTAWKSKPSWYIVGKKDHTVHPDLERFFAKRMGATTYELDTSHVPMLSQPESVLDVIRTAAKAVGARSASAS